ncbi:MAG TPA: hypothetical protein PLL71_14225, partial [Agriterribacter sp.]|nr:hypothetical protein [Agriterribacter sp.]
MKRFTFSFFLLIALPCAAQEKNDHPGLSREKAARYLPSLTRSLGGSFQQFKGLNARVENLPQYEQLKGYTPTLGLGWMKEKDRFIADMGITLGSSMSRHRDKKSSTI